MQLFVTGGYYRELCLNLVFTNLVTNLPSTTLHQKMGRVHGPSKIFLSYIILKGLSSIFFVPTLLV
jgi:hypothetical protein